MRPETSDHPETPTKIDVYVEGPLGEFAASVEARITPQPGEAAAVLAEMLFAARVLIEEQCAAAGRAKVSPPAPTEAELSPGRKEEPQ